jgi:hypothetical protein
MMKKCKHNSEKDAGVERVVIRQLLEEEIVLLDKGIEDYEEAGNLISAAQAHIKRQGTEWALYVLSVKLGV